MYNIGLVLRVDYAGHIGRGSALFVTQRIRVASLDNAMTARGQVMKRDEVRWQPSNNKYLA